MGALIQDEERGSFKSFMDEGLESDGFVVGLPLIKGGYAWFFRRIENGSPINPIETFSAPEDSLDRYLPPMNYAKYPTWFIDRQLIY